MLGLFVCLQALAFLSRKKAGQVYTVGILFLPVLGLGDLVMLSPIVQKIQKLFKGAKISLITWTPDFIDFDEVEYVDYKKVLEKKMKFDLIISPTLNLKHILYIFRAKYWIGYFATNKIQSNFASEKYSYEFQDEHYIWRGIRVIKSLNDPEGGKMIERGLNKNFSYPKIKTSKPEYFDSMLGECKYLVLGVFSKWEDRQWPMENSAVVAREALERGYVEKVVLIGDKSDQDKKSAQKIKKLIGMPDRYLVDTTGKNSLPESSYVIEKSHLFFGLDSGPSHIAYNLAPRSVVIFVTVEPKLRLPLSLKTNAIGIYPNPGPKKSLYNGLGPVDVRKVRQYLPNIKIEQVLKAMEKLIK